MQRRPVPKERRRFFNAVQVKGYLSIISVSSGWRLMWSSSSFLFQDLLLRRPLAGIALLYEVGTKQILPVKGDAPK